MAKIKLEDGGRILSDQQLDAMVEEVIELKERLKKIKELSSEITFENPTSEAVCQFIEIISEI